MKPTNILLPEELKREAKIQAIREGISLSKLIRRLLEEYLAERDETPRE